MVISVRKDCKPPTTAGRDDWFSMIRTQSFQDSEQKSYLKGVRRRVALDRFKEFRQRYTSNINLARLKRDIVQAMGANFGLGRQEDRDIFDEIWPILDNGRAYIKRKEDDIEEHLLGAYSMLAQVARGDSSSQLPGNPATWKRIKDINVSPGQKVVVFSDHHFTAFSDDAPLENYFFNHNLPLYLEVLDHYAAQKNTILVENGDVEETIICELSMAEARNRKNTATNGIGAVHDFPIDRSKEKWQDYLAIKGAQRRLELDRIIEKFSAYYEKVRTRFQATGRYVKLTGNHDTYLWRDVEERPMISAVSDALGGAQIHDILRISRNGVIEDIVMHGHQFDTVSIQHDDTAWALSGGELFSESSSWCYQGPDRFWDDWQCQAWRNGRSIENALVRANYEDGGTARALSLFTMGESGLNNVADDDPENYLESILEQNIGWSHFRNDNAFEALALEVTTGQTMFKFRHLDEIALVREYKKAWATDGSDPPRVTLGHTHEPRLNPSYVIRQGTQLRTEYVGYYANSGSAGRFSNLIWAVELVDGDAKVVSWHLKNGEAIRQEWAPTQGPSNVPQSSKLEPV